MKHRSHFPVVLMSASISLIVSISAQLFVDDFESYTAGSNLNTSGPWGTTSLADAPIVVGDETTVTPFGNPNRYLDFNDNSSTASVRVQSNNIGAASGALTTFLFDFNEPTSSLAGGMTVGYSITNGDLNTSGSRMRVTLDDGIISGISGGTATYSLDTSYRLYLIFNDTASPVSYNNGTSTVASGDGHVWLEPVGGPAVFAGSRSAENTQTGSYRIGLRSFSSNLQQVLIDNVMLEEGISLPGYPPSIVVTSPADDSTSARVSANLVADFSLNMAKGTSGNIVIKEVDGDATVATIAVTDAAVTVTENRVAVDLPADLAPVTDYYVLIDAGALESTSGDPFPGIVAPDQTTWNFKTGTTGARTSSDSIIGRAQSATLGYLPNNASEQVGIGGPSGGRRDFNVILGFNLPTLPVGETISSASLEFEIFASRDISNNPALHVYLMDEENPDVTGLEFFYHGPDDPNPDVRFVGSLNFAEPNRNQVTYAPDQKDQNFTLTGDALALLESFYGGDHIPERSEAFFRFNLNQLLGGATINNFERYFIEKANDQSFLTIGSEPVSGLAAYTAWARGFTPNPGATTDNPDTDDLENFLEFAFGTDPNVSDSEDLVDDGTVNGLPISRATGGPAGVDFDFVFVRRDDHGSAGSVTYTAQFSHDLVTFFNSTTTPTFVADSTDDPAYEVVSVPYPFFLPNGRKPRFARILVQATP